MNINIAAVELAALQSPSDRLHKFIELARHKLSALVDTELWEGDVWPANGFIKKGQNRQTFNLYFYRHGVTKARGREVEGEPLYPQFKEFTKAYMRYMHSSAPVSWESTKFRLGALRIIESSFRTFGLEPRIDNLNVVVLNTAIEIAGSSGGPSRHYQLAGFMEQVFKFCKEWNFLNGPFEWRQPIRKPPAKLNALGQDAKDWRESRLPSGDSFHALGHIFRNAETFRDKLLSAISAIMASVPIRAHEVLQLREDCEVYGTTTSEDGEAFETYGIRVWPGKRNPPQVKWVPTVMVSVVQEAVARLRQITAPARVIAGWYEAHPWQVFLPPDLAHLRETEWINRRDVAALLGISELDSVNLWLDAHPDIRRKRSSPTSARLDLVNFGDFERAMIAYLPRTFPFYNGHGDQAYSQTLTLIMYNGLHATRATYRCMIQDCTIGALQDWLNGKGQGQKESVFERWGFTEADGSPMRVSTHAFRHWLNTVAQLKGLSDLDIAKWSGRDPAQNKAYNHVTPEEVLSQIKAAINDGNVVGPLFEAGEPRRMNPPADRRAFMDAQIGSAHVTDSGFCVHDYSLLPCQNYGDCLGCSENVFIKGDPGHRTKIEKRLVLAEMQLIEAEAAVDAQFSGADRWMKLHRRSINRMRRILSIHDDGSIPDGTVVNLESADQDNDVAMAFRDRAALGADEPVSNQSAAPNAVLKMPSGMWED